MQKRVNGTSLRTLQKRGGWLGKDYRTECSLGKLYDRLATHPVNGDEVLRVAITIRLGDDAGKPLRAEAALKKIREYCDSPEKTVTVSNWLYETADKLVALQAHRYWEPVAEILQARVLAVALMLADTLTETERQKVIDQWERVTFRIYGLFEKDSRSKVGHYIRLAKNVMSRAEGASRYSEIMDSLRQIGADYPVEDAVSTRLDNKNCYDGFADEARYILWRYEEYLAKRAGVDVDKEARQLIWDERTASETIEHIHPQSPEPGGAWAGKLDHNVKVEEHVHRIGNLILLPQTLNEQARRQGFTIKRTIYEKSEGLRMVREVLEKKDWTQRDIEDREKTIVEWAKKQWADRSD